MLRLVGWYAFILGARYNREGNFVLPFQKTLLIAMSTITPNTALALSNTTYVYLGPNIITTPANTKNACRGSVANFPCPDL